MHRFFRQRSRFTLLVGLRLPLRGNTLRVGAPLHTTCQSQNLNGYYSSTDRPRDPGNPLDWLVNLVMPGLDNWLLGRSPKLYENHVPVSALQKAVLAVGSSVGAFIYPERDDLVSISGETTGWYALQCLHRRMLQDPIGREILRDKPRINTNTLDLDRLRTLPEGSLGKEYTKFMDRYGFTPNARKAVKYVDDVELAYVMQRYREIHDFTHTLLEIPVSLYGEIVVKLFEGVQTGLPMCVIGGLASPIKLPVSEKIELGTVYFPWAVRSGLQGRLLMNVYFEKHLEEPLHELRTRLNLTSPPLGSFFQTI